MLPLDEAFPKMTEHDSGYVSDKPSYSELLESAGWKPLVTVESGSYQGTIHILARHADGRYGYAQISYGSCSGCDARHATDTIKDLEGLRLQLAEEVAPYPTLADAVRAIEADDRASDMGWRDDEDRPKFIAECRALLTG